MIAGGEVGEHLIATSYALRLALDSWSGPVSVQARDYPVGQSVRSTDCPGMLPVSLKAVSVTGT